MTDFTITSRCSAGYPISFRWYGFPSATVGNDEVTAVKKFLDTCFQGRRLRNGHQEAMLRAEFLAKYGRACKGQLKPVRDVKFMTVNNSLPIFEIRWQAVPVLELDESNVVFQKRVKLRMYHSEPKSISDFFIGHHIHEKIIDTSLNINQLQDNEIRTAEGYYLSGKVNNWGIPVDRA